MATDGFTVGVWRVDAGNNVLGHGSFANVYKGYKIDNPEQVVAIKVVDVARLTKGNKKLRQHLASEVQIMTQLDHENIVKLLDVITVPNYFVPPPHKLFSPPNHTCTWFSNTVQEVISPTI